jgi:hypothetical protein
MTSDPPRELISEGVFTPQAAADAGAGIVASEYFVTDLNTFASLTARRVPASAKRPRGVPSAAPAGPDDPSDLLRGSSHHTALRGSRLGARCSLPCSTTPALNHCAIIPLAGNEPSMANGTLAWPPR